MALSRQSETPVHAVGELIGSALSLLNPDQQTWVQTTLLFWHICFLHFSFVDVWNTCDALLNTRGQGLVIVGRIIVIQARLHGLQYLRQWGTASHAAQGFQLMSGGGLQGTAVMCCMQCGHCYIYAWACNALAHFLHGRRAAQICAWMGK